MWGVVLTCSGFIRVPGDLLILFGGDWHNGWSLNVRNESWKHIQERCLFTHPNGRVCPGRDFCFTALSLRFFFFNQNPQKKAQPVLPPQTEPLNWALWRVLENYCSSRSWAWPTFIPRRAGFFLLPSSPELNLLKTKTSPNYIHFLAVLTTIPFSCQVGYC